jgi:hypothetical protein
LRLQAETERRNRRLQDGPGQSDGGQRQRLRRPRP